MSKIKDHFITDRENEVFNDLFSQEPYIDTEYECWRREWEEMQKDPAYNKWLEEIDEHI